MSPLQPKRSKFRKFHKGRTRGKASRNILLQFGDVGIQALQPGRLTDRQIESIRLTLTRKLDTGARLWIRVFPDQSVTKKPLETRMGGGKGDIDHWNVIIRPGTIIAEVGGMDLQRAQTALRSALYKIPFQCHIVTRTFWEGSAYAAQTF